MAAIPPTTPGNSLPTQDSDYVALYRHVPGEPMKYYTLKSPSDFRQHANANTVIFIRGLPDPAWVNEIASTYHLDPDYFRRHLDFHPDNKQRWAFFHAQSNLQSKSAHFMQLKYTTVGQFLRQHEIMRKTELDNWREQAYTGMTRYLDPRLCTRNQGESVIRAYHILDQDHFVVEQQASIYFVKGQNKWAG